jgi:hypothetical protein
MVRTANHRRLPVDHTVIYRLWTVLAGTLLEPGCGQRELVTLLFRARWREPSAGYSESTALEDEQEDAEQMLYEYDEDERVYSRMQASTTGRRTVYSNRRFGGGGVVAAGRRHAKAAATAGGPSGGKGGKGGKLPPGGYRPVEPGAARPAGATPVGAGERKKLKKQRQKQKAAAKRAAKSAGEVPGGPDDVSST